MTDYCTDCGRLATRVLDQAAVCDYCAGHRDGYLKGCLDGRASGLNVYERLIPFMTDGRWEADAALEHYATYGENGGGEQTGGPKDEPTGVLVQGYPVRSQVTV